MNYYTTKQTKETHGFLPSHSLNLPLNLLESERAKEWKEESSKTGHWYWIEPNKGYFEVFMPCDAKGNEVLNNTFTHYKKEKVVSPQINESL